MIEAIMTIGTNQPATWSTKRCMGARLRWASATICTILDNTESAPTLTASTNSVPVPFTVPPVTVSPATFDTGIGSPVTIDSSTLILPSITIPSTGSFSPVLTRSLSPVTTHQARLRLLHHFHRHVLRFVV